MAIDPNLQRLVEALLSQKPRGQVSPGSMPYQPPDLSGAFSAPSLPPSRGPIPGMQFDVPSMGMTGYRPGVDPEQLWFLLEDLALPPIPEPGAPPPKPRKTHTRTAGGGGGEGGAGAGGASGGGGGPGGAGAGFHEGGQIPSPGAEPLPTGEVMEKTLPGEFIMTQEAVAMMGEDFFQQINDAAEEWAGNQGGASAASASMGVNQAGNVQANVGPLAGRV